MVDHNGFDRTFSRFEFESQLFLNRGEKRWSGNVIAGQTGNPVQMDIEGFEFKVLKQFFADGRSDLWPGFLGSLFVESGLRCWDICG